MKKISYYIFLFFLRALALLPLRVLYGISFFFYLLAYGIGYRKKVVRKNLKIAFPEKTEDELRKVEKGFYKHFCDIFMETIAMNYPLKKKVVNRVTLHNVELLNQIYDRGQEVIAVAAHHANWELPTLFPPYVKHTVFGVYKPLSNYAMDKIMQRNRALFGCIPVAMNDLYRKALEYKKKKEPAFIYLIADQRPAPHLFNLWLPFFGVEVPVIEGPEKMARKLKCPVVYMHIKMFRKGHYDIYFSLICDNPDTMAENQITKEYYEKLEENIVENPALYLWTHNRWKNTR